MGYKDPDKRRAYDRAYKSKLRIERKSQSEILPPIQLFQQQNSDFRIKTAADILQLLSDTIKAVRALNTENSNEAIQQARAIGYLAGVALKAVETEGIERRIIALEAILQLRGEENHDQVG